MEIDLRRMEWPRRSAKRVAAESSRIYPRCTFELPKSINSVDGAGFGHWNWIPRKGGRGLGCARASRWRGWVWEAGAQRAVPCIRAAADELGGESSFRLARDREVERTLRRRSFPRLCRQAKKLHCTHCGVDWRAREERWGLQLPWRTTRMPRLRLPRRR